MKVELTEAEIVYIRYILGEGYDPDDKDQEYDQEPSVQGITYDQMNEARGLPSPLEREFTAASGHFDYEAYYRAGDEITQQRNRWEFEFKKKMRDIHEGAPKTLRRVTPDEMWAAIGAACEVSTRS